MNAIYEWTFGREKILTEENIPQSKLFIKYLRLLENAPIPGLFWLKKHKFSSSGAY